MAAERARRSRSVRTAPNKKAGQPAEAVDTRGVAIEHADPPEQLESATVSTDSGTLRAIALASIIASQRNPRQRITGLDGLAASLQTHGLLQPVVVREHEGQYELIAGHRRLAAARQLGWQSIVAVVRNAADDEAYLLTLIENLQREDLTAREEADALAILVRHRGWSTRQVAEAVQRSAAFVSKRLRVFEDPMLAPAVLADQLSISAAEELLSIPERQRNDVLARAIEGGWNLPQIRSAIRERFDSKQQSAATRRPGLSRRVRDIRLELRDLSLNDLTEADRRELRQLYLDLGLLGRARLGAAAARIFPALPAKPGSGSAVRKRGTRSGPA